MRPAKSTKPRLQLAAMLALLPVASAAWQAALCAARGRGVEHYVRRILIRQRETGRHKAGIPVERNSGSGNGRAAEVRSQGTRILVSVEVLAFFRVAQAESCRVAIGELVVHLTVCGVCIEGVENRAVARDREASGGAYASTEVRRIALVQVVETEYVVERGAQRLARGFEFLRPLLMPRVIQDRRHAGRYRVRSTADRVDVVEL